ncbi:ABC transporter substrate-binding protein [Bacillus sp. FJAT-28004]|uniref:ABC transporter substrate-binding protein n=1 Tax=Bacillus sp. FJAT-28004 TaxID=1679165 RepID=UPI0006B592E6|nr:ABC transporter substrate-binding protein [Bacillus sp. FJAT-28004]
MRKNTSISRLMLASVMAFVLLLAACSSGNNDNNSSPDASPASSGANAGGDNGLKPVELTVAFPIFGAEPKDLGLVQDEINKIVKAKINATVKLMPISFGNWNQQMNLMLSGNEKLDLTVTVGGYSGAVAKGQLLPIDELLASRGSGIAEALGNSYLQAGIINGKTYGVTSVRDLAANQGILFRKDLVDKYNIDVSKIKSLDDLEPVLQLIKDKEPGVTPIAPGGLGSTFIDILRLGDLLGDGIGILPANDNGLKVVNQYEMPEYAALLKRFRKWYEAGYVLKDAATNQTQTSDLMKAGKLFSNTAGMKPGFAAQEARTSGREYVTVELASPVATTLEVTKTMWVVPKNANDPERSVMFLNLMFSDPQIVNLLDYGIEGKHYVKVAGSDNTIEFPAGLDVTNHPYRLNLNWLMGNQFLSYVFKGEDPEIWGKMDAFNKGAIKSKALGFTFNVEPVKNEMTAVSNVINQYKRVLETGTIDPEKNLPIFIDKLRDAGIDKIIVEKQKQLDAWAKTQQP